VNWTAIIVFVLLFGPGHCSGGFVAAHWRRGDLTELHEMGPGGTDGSEPVITWFLTWAAMSTLPTPSIAVPATGVRRRRHRLFFALPYTKIIVYPAWSFSFFFRACGPSHTNTNYITAWPTSSKGRYGNRWLAPPAVARDRHRVATMPYIALQNCSDCRS